MKKMGRSSLFFVLLSVVAVVAVGYTFTRAIQFSGFAAALAKVAIGMVLFYAFDVFVMKQIDTVEELKKGNVAYAVFLLGFAVVIAACIATA